MRYGFKEQRVLSHMRRGGSVSPVAALCSMEWRTLRWDREDLENCKAAKLLFGCLVKQVSPQT